MLLEKRVCLLCSSGGHRTPFTSKHNNSETLPLSKLVQQAALPSWTHAGHRRHQKQTTEFLANNAAALGEGNVEVALTHPRTSYAVLKVVI